MRASDADREATVEALKGHSAAGRIDSEELAERSGRAYGAQTKAELLVPALQAYGYELAEQTDTRLHFKLSERPVSSVVLGILTFPIGGFLLFLDKRRSQVSMLLEEPSAGHTRLTV
jgi:hypothetical protein